MSDFLKSLVARQLGEAAAVRPRLAGRFEPPPDAFAHEAVRRAGVSEEPDADALERFLEVETHAEPARDAATPRAAHEDTRAREPRRETDETRARVVFIREPREESQSVLRQEQSSARDSEHKLDTPVPSNVADSPTRARRHDEGDAPVRPNSIVPASEEETGLIRPDDQAADRAPFVTRARARDERVAPLPIEPHEPSVRVVDEVKRPSNDVRPAPPSSPALREVAVRTRAHEESSSIRNESARERERRREDEDESRAARQARRVRESSGTIEPRAAPRRERQAAARDAQRERAEVTPTINVTIGRVEVRATQGPPPAPRRAETAAPRMNLDDYLRRRNGEVRE